MTNLIGQSFDRYHILEQLGEGGMAVVYKAYDSHLDRAVAIKVILPGFEQSEKFLKRFEREAQALARLVHPNIVRVLDYGQHNGLPYLVMEYLSGGTLKQKTGQPVPWQKAARLLEPIARALAYAHQMGILHRDIKPSNILITHSGEPMLSDFGLAKLLEVQDGLDLTGSTNVIGTPAYMAPEQMTGGKVDRRADVYALGIVFYELVTGRTPYRADTPAAMMIKAVTEPLPRPTTFTEDLPENVEYAILKSLEKDPENRFQNMEDFALALERFAAERAPASPTPASILPATPAPAPTPAPILPSTPAPAPAPPQSGDVITTLPTIQAQPVGPENKSPSTGGRMPLPQELSAAEGAPIPRKPSEAPKKKKKWSGWAISAASLAGLLLVGGMAAGIYFLGGYAGSRNEPIPSPTVQIQPPLVYTPSPLPFARTIQPYQFQEGDNYPPLPRFALGWQASLEPGVRNWDVRLRANQPALIAPGWCSRSAEGLDQNFPHVSFQVEVDRFLVDMQGLSLVDRQAADMVCRRFVGIFRNWPEGRHVVRIASHLDTFLNDGRNDLPAGDYVDVFNISVLPPTPLSLSIIVLPYDPEAGVDFPNLRLMVPGYKAFSAPGVQEWSLTLNANQSAVLGQGWCSKTGALLQQNFQHIQYIFELDGVPMDMQRIHLVDEQNALGACRKVRGIIRYWPEGIHVIKATMHFDSDLNDGSSVIPAGDYVDIFNILVLPPK